MSITSSDQPRCGLCGKAEKLTRTPCCGNWICDDENSYVPFSYARNSCFRNHSMFTICGAHYNARHEGRWQDCATCRELGPLELFVHSGTNEYNFEKLENPPPFEPTHCHSCGVRLQLGQGGYAMSGGQFLCLACSEPGAPALPGQGHENKDDDERFPLGTLAYYGPTARLATKLAAAIFTHRGAEPDPLHRWLTRVGDIRDDRAIAQQVADFFRRHRVKEIATTPNILGCPHEEGKDYPVGGSCPHCPFWTKRDRCVPEPLAEGGMTAEEVLQELSIAHPTRQPVEALAAAEVHRPALLEPFLQALARGVADPSGTPHGEAMLSSYAAYCLAKWREPRAYPLFIRWLSLPGDGAFVLGGDTVTQDGNRLLAGVCGGDLQPMQDLILRREANEYCRSQAISALALLVAWKEIPHRTVSDYFLWLAREGLEREPSFVWDELANCCLDIEAVNVFPELRRAYDEGLASPGVMDPERLDAAEAGPRGKWLASFAKDHPPIQDVAQETGWWACFSDNDNPLQTLIRDLSHERARNLIKTQPSRPVPKTGRNEPCPCGSGKKYKKCCGQ